MGLVGIASGLPEGGIGVFQARIASTIQPMFTNTRNGRERSADQRKATDLTTV